MENCKFCSQELEEGSTVCPHCGRDNAVEETPVTEAVEETVTETAAQEAPAVEQTQETAEPELAEEAAPEQVKKATPGKIALAVGAVVVLLAVLIALIVVGVKGGKTDEVPAGTEETIVATIPEDGDPNDATCKGSYTVTDEEAIAAKDTVIATIGGHELTNGELQVHYWSCINSFLTSEQGYYVMMYGGIDYAQPLDTQRCVLDEKLTWQQHFLQQALNNWQISCGLAQEAEKAGVVMTQEEQAFVDGIEAYLDETAASYGMTTDELLRRNVGSGAGVPEFKAFQELYTRGSGYYASKIEHLVPTEQELEAFFDEHAEGYASSGVTKDGKFVDVRHILVTIKGDENAEDSENFTDEDWSKCEAEAQAILDSWLAGDRTEESFAAFANEKSEDPGSNTTGGLYEKIYLGQMVKPFEDWCFDETRKAGDYGLVKTDYGYHVMYFVSSAPQWTYYAERDWRGEQVGQLLKELAESYPMEVEYSQIVLGNLLMD